MAMHLLVALVVVPVACGVGTGGTAEGLLARVPQHVAFEVHALVAAVVAEAAAERLVPRVDAAVPLEVGQVATGVGAERALVGLFSRVHTLVALQVVQVGGGVGAAGAAEGLLAAVRLHVPGQVVGVVSGKGAEATGEALVTGALGPPAGATPGLSSHAPPTSSCSQAAPFPLPLLQLLATVPAGPGEEQLWQGFRSRLAQALPFTPQLPTVRQEAGTT